MPVRDTPVTAVLGLLERLHTAATDAGRDGSVLEIRVLQALAHHAAGDLPEALAALGRALGGAPEPDSYVRLFLDEGAPMLALLQQAASDPAGETVQGQVRRLLDRAQAPRTTPSRSSPWWTR